MSPYRTLEQNFCRCTIIDQIFDIHVPPYKHSWLLSYLEGHRSSASDSRSEPQGHPVSSDELKTWWNSSSPEELDDFRFLLLSFGLVITYICSLLKQWPRLPETMQSHYKAAGTSRKHRWAGRAESSYGETGHQNQMIKPVAGDTTHLDYKLDIE